MIALVRQVRLSTGPARLRADEPLRWMGDDKKYVAGSRGFNDDLVACWQRGTLFVNAGSEGPPCLGLRRRAPSRQAISNQQSAISNQQLRFHGRRLDSGANSCWLSEASAADPPISNQQSAVRGDQRLVLLTHPPTQTTHPNHPPNHTHIGIQPALPDLAAGGHPPLPLYGRWASSTSPSSNAMLRYGISL